MKTTKSPYLKDGRLAKVIASIQVMGVYKFYKLDFKAWADRIYGDESLAVDCKLVFTEHPEFFRLDQTRSNASLVWRRTLHKSYNVDTEDYLTPAEYIALNDKDKKRVSRKPLSDEDINLLIEAAIKLHESALKSKSEKRWWIGPSLVIIGFLVGLIPTILNSCENQKLGSTSVQQELDKKTHLHIHGEVVVDSLSNVFELDTIK